MTHPRHGTPGVNLKGMAVLIVLCASWGINQVAIKTAILHGVPPVLQAGIRSMGSATLVILWMALRKRPILERDGTLGWGILVGVLFSVEFVFIYWGLSFTNASRSVIFLNTAPFVVALGAHLFIAGDQLSRGRLAGMILAFCGILIAFHESVNLPSQRMFIGDVMLLVAAFFWGSVTVIVKASPLARISPSKTLLYQLGVSALILPLASLALGEGGCRQPDPTALASMAYQIVWVAFITYVAWFWLIRTYPVSRIAPFTFLTPLFGVMAGAFFLGEPLTPFLFCALVLVGSGIYLVNRK